MAEELKIIKSLPKEEKYQSLIPQVFSLTENENDFIANLANIAAALKYGLDFFWVGFYFVKGEDLVLGPFQGPVACTRIGFGKGVCGASWKEKTVIIVDDVEKFPGHIACSSDSRSEIVLPIFDSKRNVVLILDIDSEKISAFDQEDKKYLVEVVGIIEKKIENYQGVIFSPFAE